jgi:hypothetical protein|tara:strand:+ start:416 stop:1381 length:966 start_codon:yes stop_codon:yes gene_type:complete
MPTINSNDIFLVQRGSNTYKLNAEDLMSTILDTDYLLINRGSNSYKVTAADVKDQLGGPSIPSAVVSSATTPFDPTYYYENPTNNPENQSGAWWNGNSSGSINIRAWQSYGPGMMGPGTAPVGPTSLSNGSNYVNENFGYMFKSSTNYMEYTLDFTNNPIYGELVLWCNGYLYWHMAGSPYAQVVCGGQTKTMDKDGTVGRSVTFTGLNGATSAVLKVGQTYTGQASIRVDAAFINGQPCVWGEKRCEVTVDDASVFSAGDAVMTIGSSPGASARIMSFNGNTIQLYNVIGTFSSGDTIYKADSGAAPPSNTNASTSLSPL